MALVKDNDTFKRLKEDFIFETFKSLEDLRTNKLFPDLVLVSKDGVEFKVHKTVVYLTSGYFKGIYLTQMKESVADRINLDFVSGHILEHIISFMYEAELKTNNAAEIEEIAEKSDFLQIDQLREMCLLVLMETIADSNCLKFWRLAVRLAAEKFEETCIVYILQSAKILFEQSAFLNDLSADEIKKLLTDRRLPFSQEYVYKYALRWSRNDIEKFNEVIDCIQFPLLSKQFLLSDVLTNEFLMQNKKVVEKIIECSRYKWREDVLLGLTSPLIGSRQKAFLAVVDSNVVQISSSGEILNPNNDIEFFRYNFGYTTFYDNFLFICGGTNSTHRQKLNSCEYYSPNIGEFKPFPPLEVARVWHECSLIGDQIYVLGGCDSQQSVEIFDLGTETWRKGPPMTSLRIEFGLASVNRTLYAIGGISKSSVEFLDSRSNYGWTTINDEFTPFEYTQCIPIGAEIYCFRRKDNVYIFDTRMNKRRKVDSGYNEFRKNLHAGFRICKLDGDFGVVFPKSNNVELLSYNTKGEVIFKKELNAKTYSSSLCLANYYNYCEI